MPAPSPPSVVQLADGTIDLRRGLVQRNGATDRLTTREHELLAYLAARPEQVVPTEELNTEVWKLAPRVQSRAVFHTAQRLRKKIEVDPREPVHLLTVYGEGYRLVPAPPGGSALHRAAQEALGLLSPPDSAMEEPLWQAAEQALAAGHAEDAALMACAAARCRPSDPAHLPFVERVLDAVPSPMWSCRLHMVRTAMTPDSVHRRRILSQAMAEAEAAGSAELQAYVLVAVGVRCREAMELDDARRSFARARGFVETGQTGPGVEALLCKSEAAMARVQGDWTLARDRAERALAIELRGGAPCYAGWSHQELALIAMGQGQTERALHHFGRAAEQLEEGGEDRGAAIARQNRAIVLYELGRTDEAGGALEAMVDAIDALRDDGTKGTHLAWLAQYRLDTQRSREAIELAEDALVFLRSAGWGPARTMARGILGLAHLAEGRTELAAGHLNASLRLAQEMGHTQALAESLCRLALLAHAIGDVPLARAHLAEAEAAWPDGTAVPLTAARKVLSAS